MNCALGWTVRSKVEWMFSRTQIVADSVSTSDVRLQRKYETKATISKDWVLLSASYFDCDVPAIKRISQHVCASEKVRLSSFASAGTGDEDEFSSQDRSNCSGHEHLKLMLACRNSVDLVPSDIYCCCSQ